MNLRGKKITFIVSVCMYMCMYMYVCVFLQSLLLKLIRQLLSVEVIKLIDSSLKSSSSMILIRRHLET